jgi:hypothetical protein
MALGFIEHLWAHGQKIIDHLLPMHNPHGIEMQIIDHLLPMHNPYGIEMQITHPFFYRCTIPTGLKCKSIIHLLPMHNPCGKM